MAEPKIKYCEIHTHYPRVNSLPEPIPLPCWKCDGSPRPLDPKAEAEMAKITREILYDFD